MYLDYFGLKKEPFHITPDPDFLFLSPSHREALGSFIYGVEKRKGFISVIGEVGTGKTTIIRSYLTRIDPSRIKPIYIFNTNLSFRELLITIFEELSIVADSENVNQLTRQLHNFLIEGYRRDQNFVLIIDEAHNMPTETLENLRMLSNLETNHEKLIQILLIGQPELENKLDQHKLRQLKQRMAIRATLRPLSYKETIDYIHHRLSVAALTDEKRFSRGALRRIARYSKGMPRITNILCDNALIAGFGFQKKPVKSNLIKMVMADYEGRKHPGRLITKFAFFACLFCITATLFHLYLPELSLTTDRNKNLFRWAPDRPTHFKVDTPETLERSFSRASSASMTPKDKSETDPVPAVMPEVENNAPADSQFSPTIADLPHENVGERLETTSTPTLSARVLETDLTMDSTAQQAADPHSPDARPLEIPDGGSTPIISEKTEAMAPAGEVIIKTVRPGDCLSRLCDEVYGDGSGSNRALLFWVKRHNPNIKSIDIISVGDKIVFPKTYNEVSRYDKNI